MLMGLPKKAFSRRSIVCLAGGLLVALVGAAGDLAAQTAASLPNRQATVHALSMTTPLGASSPQGDVEEITCRLSLTCARCHVLSTDFAQAAAVDDSWIDASTCKLAEVKEGNAGKIWVDGITVMSETLESVRAAVLYLRDYAPEGYRLPKDLLARYDISFSFGIVPLITRGTSAGLSFLMSAYSAAAAIPIMPQVAVTGAITEDGKVGPVGAIPEKVAAAAQLGFSTVIIPASHYAELSLLPPDLPRRIRIILADTADQALFHALGQAGPRGAEYDAMCKNYLAAVALANQGETGQALSIFSQLATMYPEDYSLRVWVQYLQALLPTG